jgi:hypothetical protein
VPSRLRLLTALTSIALVALDVVLSALGHSHAHPLAKSPAADACPAAAQCGHHHGCSSHDEEESSAPSDSHDSDDCSLCRHFNQPVAVAAFVVEIAGGERAAPVVLAPSTPYRAAVRPVYPARGPPAASV